MRLNEIHEAEAPFASWIPVSLRDFDVVCLRQGFAIGRNPDAWHVVHSNPCAIPRPVSCTMRTMCFWLLVEITEGDRGCQKLAFAS